MGLKDTAAKNFFGRPEVLACLLEYVLPKVVGNIQEDKLRLVSGEYYRILKDDDGQYITDNLFRDQLFERELQNYRPTAKTPQARGKSEGPVW